jgi:pilus assembly protein CpaE
MIHAIVHDSDPYVTSILREILSAATGIGETKSVTDWDALRKALAMQMKSVVVLGPNVSEGELHHVMAITRDHPGTGFVLVTDRLDPRSLQTAMRHGVRDVVAVEDSEKDLPAAVVRAHALMETESPARRPAPADAHNGKVIATCGPKGGTGKTMVASNVAVLSAQAGVKTALLDASSGFGDCAAFLHMRPERTLTEIAGVSGELDETVLAAVLAKHPSGLELLCSSDGAIDENGAEASLITRAITALRKSFDLVYVDTGPTMDARAVAVLEASDVAYLVTSLDLPAVKDAKLCLAALEAIHVDVGRIRIILNRADSKVGFPPDEVAKALRQRVAAELPSDVSVPRAINQGIPVHEENPRAKVTKSLQKLASDVRHEFVVRAAGAETERSRLRRSIRPRLSQG